MPLYVLLMLQVAFGRDLRNWCSDMPELKKEGKGEGEGELMGLLDHTKEGLQISIYYLFFNVSM